MCPPATKAFLFEPGENSPSCPFTQEHSEPPVAITVTVFCSHTEPQPAPRSPITPFWNCGASALSFHVTCITALQQPLPCAKEDYGCLFNPPPTHSPSYHAHVKHRDVALRQTLNTGHWCIEISLCIPRKHSYCCLESTRPDGNLLCCLASGRLAAAIGCSVRIGRLQEMLAAKKVLSSDKKRLHVKLCRRSESVLEEIWRSRGLWERERKAR